MIKYLSNYFVDHIFTFYCMCFVSLKKYLILFLTFMFLFSNYGISQTLEKIKIEIQELKEEVPFYRTFKITIKNPYDEPRTILGKINFMNQDTCHIYIELKELESKEIIKHCKVQKRKINYEVVIEKILPYILQE